jgi:hypothetical protein
MRAIILAMAAATCLATPAHAQPARAQSPEALAKVYACTSITDAAARLACFDAAVAGMRSAEAGGEFAAVDAARVRQIERETFGFSLPSLPRLGFPGGRRDDGDAAEPPQSQAMKIARLGRFDGREAFTMENGQVWIALEAKDNRNARPGADVTIRKASLGSYLMSFDAGGPALRVRRVQ